MFLTIASIGFKTSEISDFWLITGPFGYEKEHVEFYHRHNREVREYFRDRGTDLLEVCWENGDGWGELSKFLGHPTPAVPFPHERKGVDQKGSASHYLMNHIKAAAFRFLRFDSWNWGAKKVNRYISE